MAELTTVARPYAKAVFQFALEKGELSQWSDMLAFAAVVASDEAMSDFLSMPQLTSDKKAEVFMSICEGKLSDGGKNLIAQLAENKRLEAIPAIQVLFEALLAEQEKSVDVNVETAFALSDAETDKLIASLKVKLGREVKLESTINESLIGGVIIHAGDLVIDASVKGKLAKLANELNS